MKIYLEESSWSGWAKESEPKLNKYEYELISDVKNIVRIDHVSHIGAGGEPVHEDREAFSFTITEIQDDYVLIKTNMAMSEGDGGISLLSDETTFKIEKNKKLTLKTQTMDFGYIYTFELR